MAESKDKLKMNAWWELTILAVIVMEISWGVPWLQMLSPPLREHDTREIFLLFLLLLISANLIARLLNNLNLKRNLHRGLVLGFIVLSGILSLRFLLGESGGTHFTDFLTLPIEEVSSTGRLIPPEIWILIANLLIIWRGFILAQSLGGQDTVFISMFWGIGLYAAYGILSALTHQRMSLWLLYSFITSALLAMVTSRVSTLVRKRGGTKNPFDFRWVISILSVIAGVTGIAALVSGILSRQIDQLNGVFKLIIYVIVSILVIPIAYIFKIGEPAIQAVSNLMPTPTPAPLIPAWEQDLQTATGPNIVNEVQAPEGGYGLLIQAFLIGAALLLLVVVVLRISKSWRLPLGGQPLGERQSLLEGTNLWEAFLTALRSWILRSANDLSSSVKLRQKERQRAAARIRRIYSDFMDLCDELGQPRPAPITPLEFLPSAEEVFPSLRGDIEAITHSYLRVRYGELPETRQDVDIIETAWKRVSDQGNMIKKQSHGH